MHHRDQEQRIRNHAVLELHRKRVIEQIAPPRGFEKQPRSGWYQRAVNVRPGVVDLARAQPCDQGTEIKLNEGQHQQYRTRDLHPHMRYQRRSFGKPPQRPDNRCEDQKSQHEVGG